MVSSFEISAISSSAFSPGKMMNFMIVPEWKFHAAGSTSGRFVSSQEPENRLKEWVRISLPVISF